MVITPNLLVPDELSLALLFIYQKYKAQALKLNLITKEER